MTIETSSYENLLRRNGKWHETSVCTQPLVDNIMIPATRRVLAAAIWH